MARTRITFSGQHIPKGYEKFHLKDLRVPIWMRQTGHSFWWRVHSSSMVVAHLVFKLSHYHTQLQTIRNLLHFPLNDCSGVVFICRVALWDLGAPRIAGLQRAYISLFT